MGYEGHVPYAPPLLRSAAAAQERSLPTHRQLLALP